MIGLVLKWSPRLRPDTIERHREVALQKGAVWWARLTYAAGKAGLAAEWLEKLREQIRTSHAYVFLHSSAGGTWRARLVDIATDRDEVDELLVPSYYDATANYSLWVKLTDFHLSDPSELTEGYVLARSGDPVTSRGLNSQTPLIVRTRDCSSRTAP